MLPKDGRNSCRQREFILDVRQIELAWHEKRIAPHFTVPRTIVQDLVESAGTLRAGICLVTGQGNERTTLVGMIPAGMPCGHAFATATVIGGGLRESQLLVSVLNSFVVDWLLRLQVSNNIGLYHLSGLPFAGRLQDRPGNQQILDEITKASSRLLSTTPEMAPIWLEANSQWPEEFPIPWDRERTCLDILERARLRAEIDARVAMLYGLSAKEYTRILSTFQLLDQDQPRLPGDYFIRQTNKGEKIEPRGFITRDLALLRFLELSEAEAPNDIVSFYAEAGISIERNTGPIRDLRTRVEEATKRGAVAYIPTRTKGKGWRPNETPFLPPDLPDELVDDWQGNVGNHIASDPSINNGEPTLIGTRITVSMVYDLLKQGWTFAQVLESYPHLTAKQVAVALRWGDLQ
jgi:uncharacterized protein (DUF433 family)